MVHANELPDDIWEKIARGAPASLMRVDRRRRNIVDTLMQSDPIMHAAMQNARIAREDRRQILSNPSDRRSVLKGRLRPGDAVRYLRPLRRLPGSGPPGFAIVNSIIQTVPEGDMHPDASFLVMNTYGNSTALPPRSIRAQSIYDVISKRPNNQSELYTDQRPPQGSRHTARQPKQVRRKRGKAKSSKRGAKRSCRL